VRYGQRCFGCGWHRLLRVWRVFVPHIAAPVNAPSIKYFGAGY
jgi:hypothetical protein